jgi:CBS domain-containing protein
MATVKDILAKKGDFVEQVGRGSTVVEAAQRMNERHIGAVVVTDGEAVVGIFSERDLLGRVVAARKDPASTRVGDVMSTPVAVCHLNTSLDECRSVMTAKRVRHMPVVEEGRLVGIITSGDIMAAEVQVQQQTIEYLHEYLYGQHR